MTITNIAAQQKRLTKLQGESRTGSVRSPHREDVASYLTPQKLARVLRAADEGDVEAFLTLAQEMEERDPHYRSVLHTRKMAVSGIVPRLELPSDEASKEIAEHVEQRITKAPMFEGLVFDLLDGIAKGFACVEIVWQLDAKEWYPLEYRFREQRFFCFDDDTMSIPMLRTDDISVTEQGEALDPYKWIVHVPKLGSGIPIRTGIARPQSVCYAAKRWTNADWMAFLDLFGIPIRIGKYPASMAEKKKLLLDAVQRIGSDAAAVIPEEMEILLLEAKAATGGSSVFLDTVDYWDKQTSKLVVGQTMTSDDGASLAQSKTHETVRFDIRDADGRNVAATIDAQLIRPFIILNHGEQAEYPSVIIHEKRPEDIVPLMQATKTFVDLGGKVQESEARDRLGYQEPEEGADLLTPSAKAVQGPPGTDPDEDEADEDDDGGNAPPVPPGEADEDDDDDEQPETDREKNAAAPPPKQGQDDVVDAEAEDALSDYHALIDSNVGRAIIELQEADTYEAARALLDTLTKDQGEVLDIGALVVSLARSMYKLRGVGDGTDSVKP
jgi:phage gp29-like protein